MQTDCQLSTMWTEILKRFPWSTFISYKEGPEYARLKFRPDPTLSDLVTLIYDGTRFCYLINIDD